MTDEEWQQQRWEAWADSAAATLREGGGSVPTPAEFAARMRAAVPGDDTEAEHMAADRLMCETLRAMGYGDGVAVFEASHRWYS